MGLVSVPCGICPADIGLGLSTCPGCGRPVTEQDRAVLQMRLEGSDHDAAERGKRVRTGANWIGGLAILIAVSAPIMFALQKMDTERALENLSEFEDDETLEPIAGKTYTAGELRKAVSREPYLTLIGHLILAVLLGALWFWALKAPLPAIACALAVFIVVQVVSAVIEPSHLYKGIIIKVLALIALGKGLKAALAARVALLRPGAP